MKNTLSGTILFQIKKNKQKKKQTLFQLLLIYNTIIDTLETPALCTNVISLRRMSRLTLTDVKEST